MKDSFAICIIIIYLVVLFIIGYNIHKNEEINEQNDKVTTETVAIATKSIEDVAIEKIEEYDNNSSKVEEDAEPAFYLSDYERTVVECMVMGESGGESYEGQLLVAFCILNACLKDGIEPSKVREEYKYSGWNESPTDSIKNAVSEVFDNGYKPIDEYILYFYAPKYSKGKWHETQRFVIEEGGHRFFAEWEN